MAEKLLLDTDIAIEYLRGREQAQQYVDQLPEPLYMSSITVAEIYAGSRPSELDSIRKFIRTFDVINLTPEIAQKGGLYRKQYKPSHGTGLADALIAASAAAIEASVVTFNTKHFPMLDNVIRPY